MIEIALYWAMIGFIIITIGHYRHKNFLSETYKQTSTLPGNHQSWMAIVFIIMAILWPLFAWSAIRGPKDD
jgi:hypothetical protein